MPVSPSVLTALRAVGMPQGMSPVRLLDGPNKTTAEAVVKSLC
jgi:hypothetical protein